jgi:hypothetical protein
MKDRRSLIQGLTDVEDIDTDLAEEFIATGKSLPPSASTPDVAPAPAEPALPPSLRPRVAADTAVSSPLTGVGRVPVGARVRTEIAAALKRASLERQLQGIQPNSVQEIIEDSLELWLLKHGHLG